MDLSQGKEDDASDTESISGASGKSASSLLSRRSGARSGLSIASDKQSSAASSYRDLLLSKGYQITGIIGRGQNSGFVVHSAMKKGEKVAVKVSTESEQEGTNGDALRREFAILSKLKHERIVSALNIWHSHVDEGTRGSAMVLEFCHGSTLNRWLPWAESSFDMSCRRECLWQIADAVEYMHSMDIAHRDLHSKNVLVKGMSQDGAYTSSSIRVKVVDFGCATALHSEASVEDDVNVNILPVKSTQPCDVFALGLLGCSLVAGKEMSSWSVVSSGGGDAETLQLPRCGLREFHLTKVAQEYLYGLLNVHQPSRFLAAQAVSFIPEAGAWLLSKPKKLSL